MAKRKAAAKAPAKAADGDGRAFLAALDHPLKGDYAKARAAILAANPKVRDGVKWNSLSFKTTEWFATVNLRARDAVQLVFHLGAKARAASATKGLQQSLADPAGLVRWLAKDRCLVTLGKGEELARNRPALAALVKQWIAWV